MRTALPALAAILLAAGLVIDLGYTQPRLREMRRLSAVRLETINQMAQMAAQGRERRYLEGLLGAVGFPGGSSEIGEDPLDFLRRVLNEAGLERLELSTHSVLGSGSLQRGHHSLRVRGAYNEIVRFVRSLEMGERLTTVDALSILPATEAGSLEARIDFSTYTIAAR